MLYPYTLTPLPLESQSTEPLPERKYGARRQAEVGRPGRKLAGSEIWDDSAYGMEKSVEGRRWGGESSASAEITPLQSLELKHEYRGGGEGRCCIPRTNHCTANSGVELRARWNKFVWAASWKVDSQHKDGFSVVHTNFPSCPFDWQAEIHWGLPSFSSSTAWRKSTMLTVNAG